MEEKSVFLEREGYTPKNKVLDFLIIAQDFDYSLKEIAKNSMVSYPCIKQLKKELVNNKWITLIRKVGKAQMYKLNLKSKKVQKFVDFYWVVVNEEVEKKLGIKEEEKRSLHHSSSINAMPVSAKHIF